MLYNPHPNMPQNAPKKNSKNFSTMFLPKNMDGTIAAYVLMLNMTWGFTTSNGVGAIHSPVIEQSNIAKPNDPVRTAKIRYFMIHLPVCICSDTISQEAVPLQEQQ
jgi:hypothetical protein